MADSKPSDHEAVVGSGPSGIEVAVTLRTLAGQQHPLPLLLGTATVGDLAHAVRDKLGTPIATQNLIWGSQLLKDTSASLQLAFGGAADVELTVCQRQLTRAEKIEMHNQLIRCVAAGLQSEVRELIKEGALQVLEARAWDETEEQEDEHEHDKQHTQRRRLRSIDSEGGEQLQPVPLTPILTAIAAGDEAMAAELRCCGATEPDMAVRLPSLGAAFSERDLVDVAKHIAAGADVNTKLMRGQGIRATGHGRPLHACCAMNPLPGAYEVAQLLLKGRQI